VFARARMIAAGMDVARLDFPHGTLAVHGLSPPSAPVESS